MIVSGTILKNTVERYRRAQKKKERYSISTAFDAGSSTAFAAFGLVVAVIFFILELLLLFYAVSTALTCTAPGPERIVNIVLSITFTIPYMLLNTLFNKCTKDRLRSGSPWLPSSTVV